MNKIIDLRSDTVTKPSKKMRQIIKDAKVGDDVYGEDPSVIELEEKIALMAKKEAAVFVPSGTQSNLLALLSHCQRGDEYICGQDAHLYKYEAGGGAVVGSIQPQPIEFEKDATLDLEKIKKKIKPIDNHHARTKLLCLENTHNGKVLSLEYIKEASKFAKENNLALHLDGARVFNAVVALEVKLEDITKYFDSVSICLSKGLGAPIGSVLTGSKEFIKEARHYRKMLGGGLRQSGLLAAAATYALDNHIKNLKKDHELAKYLTKKLKKIDKIKIISNDTNMLFIEVENSKELVEYLKNNGILISGYGELRIVVHRDISKKDIKKVIEVFKSYYIK
ncbi:low-specificity L-threonine aldolase [Halarcobacter ebronensis]|uniref:low-specificity L-threonine aldolase n=1 Tax=Halarcobacter ebronensis TaxID=1462615 RepID=UPI0013E90923|nr:low-specificity L-threonine aldolase [Halarcobacter ebronensis]QKF81822.1 threonine aldolase [Halarcobacter ebronensis]